MFSLGLDVLSGLITLGIIAAILSIVSTCLEYRWPITRYERRANTHILFVRFLHWYCVLFSVAYIFVFDGTLDIVYLVYATLLYIHWMFLENDCVLSYIEYRYYDPNYRLGRSKLSNLYMRYISRHFTNYVLITLGILSMVNFLVVAMRQTDEDIRVRLILCGLFLSYAYLASKRK